MRNERVCVLGRAIGVRNHDGRWKSLAEAERVIHAAKNRIGIVSKKFAEIADGVVHLRKNEIFLDGPAAGWQGVKLQRQSGAGVRFRDVLVNFVVADGERDESDGLVHAKFGPDVILRSGGRVSDQCAHGNRLVALAVHHGYVERGAREISVTGIPACRAPGEVHALVRLRIQHEIAAQDNLQRDALVLLQR
jgi:hypothetical protein